MSSLFKSLPFKALLAVVLTVACVALGVTFATPTHHASANPLKERLASVDTTTLTVRRAAFCSRVSEETVAAALGGPARTTASWQPGQSLRIGDKLTDVVDEYGCSWATAAGSMARAWVFSPPVTATQADALAKQKPSGCTRLTPAPAAAGEPVFGRPTSALTCGDNTMLRGLFGDAWLSCELPSNNLDLVGRWCLAVARAAG